MPIWDQSVSALTIRTAQLRSAQMADLIQPVHPKGDQSWVFWSDWKDWCWGWNSNTLATSCEELTHWKWPWCWEGLGTGGEGDDRGWDGWMASLTRCTWVWVNSGNWWWTGKPGVLQFMGSQRVGQDWATELNWTELSKQCCFKLLSIRVASYAATTKWYNSLVEES